MLLVNYRCNKTQANTAGLNEKYSSSDQKNPKNWSDVYVVNVRSRDWQPAPEQSTTFRYRFSSVRLLTFISMVCGRLR